ncbi:MAG TPA: hypothetical protein VF183_16440 [Acidimicrobiales bacterium]
MFVQVIEGKVKDPAALRKRFEVWERDLLPGAIGYLGSAGGCTANGDCILVARFESREAAERNSARPEQTRWWQETEQLFDGPVTFHDTEDVTVMNHGSIDDARFVQVMEGHVSDLERAHTIDLEADEVLAVQRPDLLGAVTAYYDGDRFATVACFTSEDEARRGESQPMSDDAAAKFAEWQGVVTVDRYLDITDPWVISV